MALVELAARRDIRRAMLTREQILKEVKDGRQSECWDRRDYIRLTEFFPVSDWDPFGFAPKGHVDPSDLEPKALTRENVLKQLERDLDFAFEKALNKRGISAHMMTHVVGMWMWVLQDDLAGQESEMYEHYGLPYLKAVAIKYGLPNPIGDDVGTEFKYSEDAEP